MKTAVRVLVCALALQAPTSLWAFGPRGHQVVGALADQMLSAHAAAQVKTNLGMTLRNAATWADCVKDVKPVAGVGLRYQADPKFHAACSAFETPVGIARMESYAQRNWKTCSTDPRVSACHKKYHFADVAVQRGRYDRAFAGTSDHDIVSAIGAAVAVLQGQPAPAPISIRDKKEALLLLAHLLGDLHQPLHVGSVYLDAQNKPMDPGNAGTPIDKATDTVGGNDIEDGGSNLHAEWDDVSTSMNPLALPGPLLAAARAVKATDGDLKDWPAAWATETVAAAHGAFDGLAFSHSGAQKAGDWVVKIPDRPAYAAQRRNVQEKQVAHAGARLAQLLNAIWP
jgi:hypothetical protein